MKISTRFSLFVVLGMVVLAAAGCGNNQTREQAAVPSADAAATDHAQAAAASFLAGEIVETMNSGGYSYVLLDTGDSRVWIAGPETEGLAAGQKISTSDGMEMRDFHAKSLDKTFASIYFVGSIMTGEVGSPTGTGDVPAGMNPHGASGAAMSGTHTVLEKAEIKSVPKLAGGHTVADIYAHAADLAGKPVKLRAQVVKFTPNIMGTNWVHIQDGSGDAASSDLTVTTAEVLAVGDIVVVEGPLSVDKDFGAGYKYHVIIEGATVTRE